MKTRINLKRVLRLSGILIITACSTLYFRSSYSNANHLLYDYEGKIHQDFLKTHLKDGSVCVLHTQWEIDSSQQIIKGYGERYDANRRLVYTGELQVPIDSLALAEVNRPLSEQEEAQIGGLAILTGVNFAMGVLCAFSPKSCFGSCPTFYLNEDDNVHYADAEGFSNAILPSLAYGDVDAIGSQEVIGDSIEIILKNEALETHCLKSAELWAFPTNKGERVLQTRDHQFYRTGQSFLLQEALHKGQRIDHLLQLDDRVEWFSLADSDHLRSKEEIILSFNELPVNQRLGVSVHFRQTLMTTYFIYSALGYMGDEASDFLADREIKGDLKKRTEAGIFNELGELEFYYRKNDQDEWIPLGNLYETGPIAINRQFIPLPEACEGTDLQLKIVGNKGLWRIDQVRLDAIIEEVEPLKLSPTALVKGGQAAPQGLERLLDDSLHLISMPGDRYQLKYVLPQADQRYELFIFSEGYYLEWMRDSWRKEKNMAKLYMMFHHPKTYLKGETAAYKAYETNMEMCFWNSRIPSQS